MKTGQHHNGEREVFFWRVLIANPRASGCCGAARTSADTGNLKAPTPESNCSAYTKDRIKKGISYATQRLNSVHRKPPPNTERILIVYRGAYQSFLAALAQGENEQELRYILHEIRAMESDLCTKVWHETAKTDKIQALQEDILQLRRMVFYMRYGDYTAKVTQNLRPGAQAYSLDVWRPISDASKWTQVDNAIRAEWADWEKKGTKAPDIGETKIIEAVWTACNLIGLDFEQMLVVIRTYAERNVLFDGRFADLLEKGKSGALAQAIHGDLEDLSKVTPTDMMVEEDYIRAIVVELRDRWFDVDFFETPDQSGGWRSTLALKEDAVAVRGAKEEGREMHEEVVAKAAAERLRELEEEETLTDQLQKMPTSTKSLPTFGLLPKSPIKKGQRKRSQASETFNSDNRRKVWKQIHRAHEFAHDEFTEAEDREKEAEKMSRAAKRLKEGADYKRKTSLEMQRQVNRLVSEYSA